MNKFENFKKNNSELLEKYIKEEKSISEMSRLFDIGRDTLRKYLKKLNIDYCGKKCTYKLESYLNNEVKINASLLRKKLIEYGIKKEECEMCGLNEWMNHKIPLELHHKNGNHNDNNLSNLEILCSNCHSVKHGYSEYKKKCKNCGKEFLTKNKQKVFCSQKCRKSFYETVEKKCLFCGKTFSTHRKNQKYCSIKCSHESFKIVNITKEDLINVFKKYKTFTSVSKYYNVSDKSVYKWCKKFQLPTSANEMKKYLLTLNA